MKCPLSDNEIAKAAAEGYDAWRKSGRSSSAMNEIMNQFIATAAYRKALEWSIQEVDWSIESVKQREQIRAKLAEMEDE